MKVLITGPFAEKWDSLVAQLVKNLPVIQETGIRSLGWPGEGKGLSFQNIHIDTFTNEMQRYTGFVPK